MKTAKSSAIALCVIQNDHYNHKHRLKFVLAFPSYTLVPIILSFTNNFVFVMMP